MVLAEELAKQQRSISVAEFFEKNKHLLGFDSPTGALSLRSRRPWTTPLTPARKRRCFPTFTSASGRPVPRYSGSLSRTTAPVSSPRRSPLSSGSLLYGSRFHQIRQTRGQQGIGISARSLYAQLDQRPSHGRHLAHRGKGTGAKFEIQIKIETNEPDIISRQPFEWDRIHGTRVQIEFKSTMSAKKKLLEYLRYTSVVNPHARFGSSWTTRRSRSSV